MMAIKLPSAVKQNLDRLDSSQVVIQTVKIQYPRNMSS